MKAAALIFASVLAARLPFIWTGYGVDADTWRLALAARTIAETGEYWTSRFIGFPLHEIASAFLIRWGAPGLNAGTAVMSALAAALFWVLSGLDESGTADRGDSSRRAETVARLAATLAFAMCPAVAVTSSTAQDYAWSLASILGATICATHGRAVPAGILVGVAAGFRATGIAAVVPLALLFLPLGTTNVRRLLLLGSIALATAAIAFSPMLMKYGTSLVFFPTATTGNTVAGPTEILRHLTVELWGRIGAAAWAGAVILCLWRWLKHKAPQPADPRHARLTCPERSRRKPDATNLVGPSQFEGLWMAFIVVFFGVYLLHAHTWHYLIPIVPFALLLARRWLPVVPFVTLCAVIAASSFISVGRTGLVPGPVLVHHEQRALRVAFVDHVIQAGRDPHSPRLVVVGAWLPWIQVRLGRSLASPGTTYYAVADGLTTFVYLPDESRVLPTLFGYLPGVRAFAREARGIDLVRSGGTLIDGRPWGLGE